ncbi:MAG: pre-peptidase C-terminal domain-containing protein [Ardenticatenaceae bacterium]|nr:pre-peptidase C-terminal domain-containing protein [Ardenticatenaceae bacterium]
MQRLRIFWIFLVLVLVACETAIPGTPTPFPTEAAVTPLPLTSSQPTPLEIADLLATPEASQNALIQLTGQYYRRPKLICESDPHPLPATWELASGEDVVLAGGFDAELRRLLPDGLTMTVEGHWLLWRGPVGCGKRAVVEDIWYLQVNRIVSPSPITQVTLTPFLAGIEVAAVGTPVTTTGGIPTVTSEATPGVVMTPTETITITIPPATVAVEEPIITPTTQPTPGEETQPTPTLTIALPSATPQLEPTKVVTATLTPGGDITATVTITPGGTENGTSEPTATLDPAVPTNTPTPTITPDPNMTATPTPTPGGDARITIQEEIEAMSLSKNVLGQNEIHAWPFIIDGSEVVTITAVTTASSTDLLISIVDEERTILAEDNTGPNSPAVIGQFELNTAGPYLIYVQTQDGSPADYALMLLYADSLNFIFQPVIAYGADEVVNLPPVSEHFWHFAGNTGDQITITVDPDDTTNVFLELYGPDANRISNPFISSGGDGVTEVLEFTLPEDGLYSIRVGEWDFGAGSYELTLIES